MDTFSDPKMNKKFYVYLEHFKLGKYRKPAEKSKLLTLSREDESEQDSHEFLDFPINALVENLNKN